VAEDGAEGDRVQAECGRGTLVALVALVAPRRNCRFPLGCRVCV
jgi:hypothetical protein